MFENFVTQVMNKQEPEQINIGLYGNPVFNSELLKEQLYSLDTIPDRDLYNIVKASFDSILKDIFKKEDAKYLEVFTTPKFLTVLTQVVSTMQLTDQQRVYCNKLAYDYMTYPHETDPYVKQLFLSLSRMINRNHISQLMAIGIQEDLASYMALARYSSENEGINVKRLNLIICTSPIELMTEQMIVYIYEKLFDRVTALFENIMFDVYDDEEEWATEEVMEIYSTVSLAILEIMNNMPSNDIRKVLISYTADFEALYNADMKKVRFSMKSISSDFSRISEVVKLLKAENIYVP